MKLQCDHSESCLMMCWHSVPHGKVVGCEEDVCDEWKEGEVIRCKCVEVKDG